MTLTILYAGAHLVQQGAIEAHALMGFLAASQNGQKALSSLASLSGKIQRARTSLDRAFDYALAVPDIPLTGGIKIPNFTGRVQFLNVDYSYPSRRDDKVLQSINLQLSPGHTTSICGPSGSGKSTLLSLLLRFDDPTSGCILVDSIPLTHLDPTWFRSQIAIISQDPALFDTSILENIRYGKLDASNDQVIAAAKEANAHDFITDLPMGYDTRVGERGVGLSSGQKQRVSIARALLRDSRVLVLDEATSALDGESERLVGQAIQRASTGRTCLVVAHKLKTIEDSDEIVCVKGGCIVERGTHGDLIKNGKTYANLYG